MLENLNGYVNHARGRGISRPPDLTISEWSDENRILSGEAAAVPGKWRTLSYQRQPMDVMREHDVNTVVMMWAAQMGKTEILLCILGYFMENDPSPIMVMQPDLNLANAFSKDRLATMLRDTPCLSAIAGPGRSTGNTLLHKTFPGGHITLCGANSPASLASRPIRLLLPDEVDRFPVSAGEEGDPLSLARKRTATFTNRKIVMTSTPTVKGASRIEMAFEQSDQRRLHIACPHCGNESAIWWRNIQWAKDEDGDWDRSAPWLICEDCGAKIEETEKRALIDAGRWVSEGHGEPGVVGFHINELYSFSRTWSEIVEDFHAAKRDTELMRVWVNTTLAETFEEVGQSIDPHWLMERCEEYPAAIPNGGVVLTAGCDVQDDRLEVQVRAWGAQNPGENWRVAYYVLPGDPNYPQVWEMLDSIILHGRWEHESGAMLGVMATCIDSAGHRTQAVYDYVLARPGARIYPTVGRGGFGRPLVSAPTDKKHGRDRRKIKLWTLGVDELKQIEYTRLGIDQPGPGYCHFPVSDDFGETYFEQLTSEEVYTKMVMGVPKPAWRLKRGHRRNEALDVSALDHAALVLLKPNMAAFEGAVQGKKSAREPEKEPGVLERRRQARRPARKGFVNGWRK